MAFSSVHEMIDLCKESGKPLYEVILESDLAESGLTRAESEAEMHRLWAVMQATSDGYCGADRSMSGFAGGDAAKVNAAAARGVLYADGYFADVMAEALKTAERNACMKRIVAAPTRNIKSRLNATFNWDFLFNLKIIVHTRVEMTL